jgi:hypothetical protein
MMHVKDVSDTMHMGELDSKLFINLNQAINLAEMKREKMWIAFIIK